MTTPKQADMTLTAKRLRGLAPQMEIFVAARSDAWFIQHPTFPFIYAFDEKVELPTPEKYRRSTREVWAFDP